MPATSPPWRRTPGRESRPAPLEVRLEARMGPTHRAQPFQQPPRGARRRERPAGIGEAVLAELGDLDPRDHAQPAAGGRRGLPRLRRLGPPPEPPQHPRALGREPLVRPAAGRLPCPAGVPGGRTRARARADRRARSPGRPASPIAVAVRRRSAGRSTSTTPRAPPRGAPARGRARPASARTDRGRVAPMPARRRGRRAHPRAAWSRPYARASPARSPRGASWRAARSA